MDIERGENKGSHLLSDEIKYTIILYKKKGESSKAAAQHTSRLREGLLAHNGSMLGMEQA